MATQANVDVSVPEEDVTVNDVPALRPETRSQPGVPPSVLLVTMIRVFAVTQDADTATLPAVRVPVPCRTDVI